MYRLLLMLAATLPTPAGVVQGIVVEHASGRPMARAIVRLDPAPRAGVKLQSLTTRTGRAGQFGFAAVSAGLYILTAQRDGYFPAAYGARLPAGRGTPIEVTADFNLFAELRLRHKGALTGRVLDENGVGAAGVQVIAYRARLPIRSVGSGVSDDRGIYRIHGLDPGKYWVRSSAQTLDDGTGWLPTYAPQARESREARTYEVTVDADTPDADVSPEPGVLFHLGGMITCDVLLRVTVILSSETGRRRTDTGCGYPYRFDGVAPGVYEIFASADAPDGVHAGYTELYADHDTDAAGVQVLQIPSIEFAVRRAGSNTPVDVPLKIIGRRQDLSETDSTREIPGTRAALTPGHWEFRAIVPSGQYVESIANLRNLPRRIPRPERASDWFEVFIEQRFPSRIRIAVSDQAGQIAGRVLVNGNVAAAAPVFLWPVAEAARRSLGGWLQTLSDTEGRFQFDSLPPGDYRVLASFDIFEIDNDAVELAHAPTVHVDASNTSQLELPLWTAP